METIKDEWFRAKLAVVEKRLVRDRAMRTALRAALRTPPTIRAIALQLLAKPLKIAELYEILQGQGIKVGKSKNRNVQKTALRTLLKRNPLRFRCQRDGRWALR